MRNKSIKPAGIITGRNLYISNIKKMNNLKKIIPAVTLLILSVITGCSDSITSSGGEYIKSSNKGKAPEFQEQISRPVFRKQISLKPGRTFTFNQANTGLSSINALDIENISPLSDLELNAGPCRSLFIYSVENTPSKNVISLSCHEVKLDIKELTVKNTGSSMIDVDVILSGTRPVVIIKNEE